MAPEFQQNSEWRMTDQHRLQSIEKQIQLLYQIYSSTHINPSVHKSIPRLEDIEVGKDVSVSY